MADTELQQLHEELDRRRIFYLNGVEGGEQELGRGAFGVVREGTWNGLPVSIKEIHKWILQTREECGSKELDRAIKGFQREMNIWALYLRHSNIVQFFGLWETPDGTVALVMELLHCSLRHFLEKTKTLKEIIPLDLKHSILLDVSRAMTYLHRLGLFHRDLSTNNILLTSHFVAKVSDFGTVRLYDNMQSGVFTEKPGTPAFMAPETDTGDYTQRVDQYAYGCVIIHVLTHEWPDKRDIRGTEFERREHLLNELTQEERRLLPLIRSCLSGPDDRWPFSTIQKQLSELPHVTDNTRYRIMHGEMKRLRERILPKAEVSHWYLSSGMYVCATLDIVASYHDFYSDKHVLLCLSMHPMFEASIGLKWTNICVCCELSAVYYAPCTAFMLL